jgi:hypothetical protein
LARFGISWQQDTTRIHSSEHSKSFSFSSGAQLENRNSQIWTTDSGRILMTAFLTVKRTLGASSCALMKWIFLSFKTTGRGVQFFLYSSLPALLLLRLFLYVQVLARRRNCTGFPTAQFFLDSAAGCFSVWRHALHWSPSHQSKPSYLALYFAFNNKKKRILQANYCFQSLLRKLRSWLTMFSRISLVPLTTHTPSVLFSFFFFCVLFFFFLFRWIRWHGRLDNGMLEIGL